MNWLRQANWKVKVLLASCGAGILTWLVLAIVAYSGLKGFIHDSAINPEAGSRVFWWIGPGTRAAIQESTAERDYSILILPFDWVESGRFVTHTAIIKDQTHTLKIRLRFNPFDGFFHIVGYTRQPK